MIFLVQSLPIPPNHILLVFNKFWICILQYLLFSSGERFYEVVDNGAIYQGYEYIYFLSLLNCVGGVGLWVAWVAWVRGCVCGAGDVDGVGGNFGVGGVGP